MIRVSSYVQYRSALNKHIILGLGHILLQKLTPRHVQAFYSTKLKEGLSPRSVALMHALLMYGMM